LYYFVPYFIQYDTYTNVKLIFFSPICTVSKQNNAVDCGVYVCRYALVLYQLRYLPITYKHLYLSDPPLSVLTKRSSIDFTHHTMKQLRQHMTKLLQNLSTLYLSNTVHIDTSQQEASAEESTPTRPVDQLQLINTSEKMGIASQHV
jgi:Ulp1 family protease